MKKIKKKHASIESGLARIGFCFTIPWLIGFVIFFAVPLIQSVLFSFSEVSISPSGFGTKFIGLENYRYAFRLDPDYMSNFKESLSTFLYQVPIILVLSFALAIILNQKFHGRLLARAIFFMPTIIASGVVMTAFNIDISATSEISATTANAYFEGAVDFEAVLMDLGFPQTISDTVIQYIQDISSLIWNCGIQIILLISGLQAIPPQLYEVSRVEGANAWEEFWFITFPMMINILLVTLAYTIIDVMTSKNNLLMNQAYNLLMNGQVYDRSAAMLWGYFPVVGIIIALVFLLLQRTLVRKWN